LDETRATHVGQLRVTRLRTDPDVLRLFGELDLATIDVLLTAARAARTGPALRVDATGVSFVDCAGLASLVELAAETRAAGSAFEISAASGPLIRLSQLTGVGDVLRIAGGATSAAEVQGAHPVSEAKGGL
jgi:anti-anti-sigma factor